jgi:hypothetical protein
MMMMMMMMIFYRPVTEKWYAAHYGACHPTRAERAFSLYDYSRPNFKRRLLGIDAFSCCAHAD